MEILGAQSFPAKGVGVCSPPAEKSATFLFESFPKGQVTVSKQKSSKGGGGHFQSKYLILQILDLYTGL